MQCSFHCVWPLKMHLGGIFYRKNGHNSVQNYGIEKTLNIVLKTTYTNFCPQIPGQYKVSFTVFASENAIFSSERRKGSWMMMISIFIGTSTPKGPYNAKSGVNCPMSLNKVH